MGHRHLRWAFNFGLWKPTREEWLLASTCIQPEERERIGMFCFARDAKASMAGRLLLRKCLAELLATPYDEIRLGRSESNRPILTSPDMRNCSFDFNVSHQGNYSVLAADNTSKVGIDVMKIEYSGGKSLAEFFHLMRRQFTLREWQFIEQPGTERGMLTRFYRLWCLKESFVKAEGVGLSIDLQRLNFVCNTPWLREDSIVTDTVLFVDEGPLDDWRFEETLLDEKHCVCTAVQIGNETAEAKSEGFNVLTFDELVQNARPFGERDDGYWQRFTQKPEQPS